MEPCPATDPAPMKRSDNPCKCTRTARDPHTIHPSKIGRVPGITHVNCRACGKEVRYHRAVSLFFSLSANCFYGDDKGTKAYKIQRIVSHAEVTHCFFCISCAELLGFHSRKRNKENHPCEGVTLLSKCIRKKRGLTAPTTTGKKKSASRGTRKK